MDVRHFFYIDLRSINAFRIALSLLIITDVVTRLYNVDLFYFDSGILPLKALSAHYNVPYYWSVLTGNTSPWFIISVFAIVITAAVLLLFKVSPHLMLVICWIGIVSIQNRNPIIYQGGDDLLRMMIFWSIFLPLTTKEQTPYKQFKGGIVDNIATICLLVQILLVLQFSALYKGRTEWWTQGSAIYYALSLDQIAKPFGTWLSGQYSFTVFLTRLVFLGELLVLPLFFLPYKREVIRLAVFILLLGIFGGIFLTMMIGIFPLCFFAASILFIPTIAWEYLERKVSGSKIQPYLRLEKTGSPLPATSIGTPAKSSVLNLTGQIALSFCLALVILWNISVVPHSKVRFPRALKPVMFSLRFNQSWGMFSPTVFKEDGWLILEAKLADSSIVDLNSDDLKIKYGKPANVLAKSRNDRFRKFVEQLLVPVNKQLLPYYADHVIHKWNKEHEPGKHIRNLSVIYMMEQTRPHGATNDLRKTRLYTTFKQ